MGFGRLKIKTAATFNIVLRLLLLKNIFGTFMQVPYQLSAQ